jgi:glycosyltransferase involved in cell wall biosynthesis
MRILTVVHDLGPGGMQRVAQNCAIAYRAAGHQSAALAYTGSGPRRDVLNAAAVDTFIGGADDATLAASVARAAEWCPDVVHVQRFGVTEPTLGRVLRALKAGVPRRFAVVETNHFARVDWSADRELADLQIQISRWCMWQWRRWGRGLPERPLGVVVPHMVRHDAFYPASPERRAAFRAAHAIPPDAVLLGRLGQPLEGYWPWSLLHSFEHVARRHPQAFLLLVGYPDSLQGRLDRLAPAVRARVRRVAFIHGDGGLRDCYSALDLFLHVTRMGDTFGLVLCESMLCGTPVVTLSTPARGNAQLEVVGHERGGLVCADLSAVPRAVQRLIDDPSLRARLGEQGGAWVRRELEPQRITSKLLRVLELAVRHERRDDLRAAIESDPELVTDVSDAEITALLGRAIGRTPLCDRMLMRLVGSPVLHRLWRRLRRRERRSTSALPLPTGPAVRPPAGAGHPLDPRSAPGSAPADP